MNGLTELWYKCIYDDIILIAKHFNYRYNDTNKWFNDRKIWSYKVAQNIKFVDIQIMASYYTLIIRWSKIQI